MANTSTVESSDVLAGKWKQLRGLAQQKWGELTDDDLDVIEGRTDRLAGKLQEKYGYTEEHARREADEFFDSN